MKDKVMYLVLEDGSVFKGKGFGADGEICGEVVFTTSMVGYLDTLTDKSYYKQIVVQTFPLIGNYGVIPSDFDKESAGPAGYIVKSWCEEPSNFRCEGDIDALLRERGVIGLYDIDTRTLTKILREKGVMNGIITADPEKASAAEIAAHKTEDAVRSVSVKEVAEKKAENGKFKVALIDLGYRNALVSELNEIGCDVRIFPCGTDVEAVKSYAPDGIVLSSGPSDPKNDADITESIRGLIKLGKPIFAVALGHQKLALACGFDTFKLKYGHRGSSQPVRSTEDGRVYITSQNTGYAVDTASVDSARARVIFVNVNDNTCEGLEYLDIPAISTQFLPTACGGPQDTGSVLEKFCELMTREVK